MKSVRALSLASTCCLVVSSAAALLTSANRSAWAQFPPPPGGANGCAAFLCFGGKFAEVIALRTWRRRRLCPCQAVGRGQGAESHGQTGGPIKGPTMRQRARAFHEIALSRPRRSGPRLALDRRLVTLPEIPASLKARQIRRQRGKAPANRPVRRCGLRSKTRWRSVNQLNTRGG